MSAPLRLCRRLRWKGFYGAAFPDEAALAAAYAAADAAFSCLATCQAWGPDDQRAAPEACGPHRACFAPSAKEPLPRLA